MSSPFDLNRNAIIRTRSTRNGKLRTETARRDEGSMQVTVTTDPRSGSTRLSITTDSTAMRLDGRSARTLFRTLAKHYNYTDKSLFF